MTRAVQTLSVLLLVSSVCYEVPPSQEHNPAWLLLTIDQLYLSLFLGLVPLNETVQTEVIPVVRHPSTPEPPTPVFEWVDGRKLTYSHPAPILRADCLRLLPSRPPGCGDLHLQRCPRGTR